MTFVRSFDNYGPPPIYGTGALPFTTIEIHEDAAVDGPFPLIDTLNIAAGTGVTPAGLDADPANPGLRDLSTSLATLEEGYYKLVWKTAAGATFTGDPIFYAATAGAVYATVAELRAEIGVDATVLPDDRATSLLFDAEDIVDSLLGSATSDPDPTGRKVAEADVEGWQWAKLSRATVKVAAALFANPQIALGRQWKREKGPDFEFWDATGTVIGSHVLALLNDSRLRRLTGRATPGYRLGSGALATKFFTTGQPRQ